MPESNREENSAGSSGWTLGLLAAGAALGLALAAYGLLDESRSRSASLSPDAVALVNGRPILRADYERLLAGVDSDTRAPLDEKMYRHVLDRMIDEELLVQRALDLGLAQIDRRVRGNLTSTLIASVIGEVEDEEPTRRELQNHFEENASYFTSRGRTRVQQLYFAVRRPEHEAAAKARAERARARLLAGEEPAEVRRSEADSVISPVPGVLLPPVKLREYLGPSVAKGIDTLTVGDWSTPLRSGIGFHVVQVIERTLPRRPELSAIEAQVRSDWRRRQGDNALREYLDDLRTSGDVVVPDHLGPALP